MDRRALLIKLSKISIPIFILTLIYFEGRKQLHHIRAEHLLLHLRMLSFHQTGSMILIGLIGVLTMVAYDFIIIRQIGLNIPSLQLLKYGWIANTFNNVIGFGGFAGASLRGMMYKKHSEDMRPIISSLLWLTPLSLSGLSVFAWLPILGLIHIRDVSITHWWLPLVLFGIALYLPGYLILWVYRNRKEGRSHFFPHLRTIISMIIASMIEWYFAALTIWSIILILGHHIRFSHLFAIFIAAGAAGVISMIPGGFGSFDLMMIIGMRLYHIPSGSIILIILLFRFVYYFIPWLIGLFLATNEVVSQTLTFFGDTKWQKRFELWRRYSTFPISIVTGVSQWAISTLIFISGLVLLLSAATPGIISRIKTAEAILSAPIMNLSNQLSVAVGIALIILSRSLFHKVKRAYTLTVILLLLGALFTFSKGFDYEEAIILLGMALLLWISKSRFYRENYPITWLARISIGIGVTIILLMYTSIGYLNEPFLHHLRGIPSQLRNLIVWRPLDLLKNSIIGTVLALIAIFIGFNVKPLRKVYDIPNVDFNKVNRVLNTYGGNALAHLAYLNDKSLFWNQDEDVFIMYRRAGDKLVVMGDPIGNKMAFSNAITSFQEYADIYGLTPLFYQVEKDYLPVYHEAGYQFFKLGEEAFVNLETFTLSGKKGKSLRAVKNKFEREGYTFEWIAPPFSHDLFMQLEQVSNEWLNGRREKGFSLGFFSEDYLNKAPVVTIRNSEGHIVSFATIMPMYDQETTLSVDIMRHSDDAPNGSMDMIFIRIMEEAKEKGYQWFNLGMAPLSNVGLSKFAFLGERIASRMFHYGNFFYQFKGLRRYKEKFADRWEPKYLAFRGIISLPVAMLQISMLIGKKPNKK